jgi:hypothetical protein
MTWSFGRRNFEVLYCACGFCKVPFSKQMHGWRCPLTTLYNEFCYGVINQCESFIYLNLMIKNREIYIERYFK